MVWTRVLLKRPETLGRSEEGMLKKWIEFHFGGGGVCKNINNFYPK